MIEVRFHSAKLMAAIPDFLPGNLLESHKPEVMRCYSTAPYEFELQHPEHGDLLDFHTGIKFRKDKKSGIDPFDVSRRLRILAASVMSEGMAKTDSLHDAIMGWAGIIAGSGASEEVAKASLPYILESKHDQETAESILSAAYQHKEEGFHLAGAEMLRAAGWEEKHVEWLGSILPGEHWNVTHLPEEAYKLMHWLAEVWDSGLRDVRNKQQMRVKDLVPLVEADQEVMGWVSKLSKQQHFMMPIRIGSAIEKLNGKTFHWIDGWRVIKKTEILGSSCVNVESTSNVRLKNGKEQASTYCR